MSETINNFTTSEGSEYAISFSLFKSDVHDIKIDVFDLVLKQTKKRGEQNYEALLHLSKLVFEFLADKNCIIYFYADFSPIKKSDKNTHLSNQEFRSKMFSTLFEKLKNKARIKGESFRYLKRTTEIKDPDGNHYITLISNIEQGEELEELNSAILSMNDK